MPPPRVTLPRLIDAVRWRLPRRRLVVVRGVRRGRLLSTPGMLLTGGGTVIARKMGPRSYALDVHHDVTVRDVTLVGAPGGYALHIHHAGAREVLVEDCTLIGVGGAALGVGVRSGQRLVFRRCTFTSDAGEPVYVHRYAPDAAPVFVDCQFIHQTGQ